VAVNLSPRQFRQPDLVQAITAILAEAGLEAHHLELEITEGVAMHDPVATQRVLEALSDMGIAIAIDDFGTGYSSLGYLQRFSLDYLKIDQSFVCGLATRTHDEHLVRSIIALAHNMDLGVIAEGVETEEQRTLLKVWGCDEAQGYLLCRPQPAAELEAILGSAI
jgi:EAL domain-containing protein (putative c-di-GMP-specific phosphodiesterase class I)